MSNCCSKTSTWRRTPEYYLWSSEQGFRIVQQVNRLRIRFLYDCYRAQISEGKLIPGLEKYIDLISTVHIGDVSGRSAVSSMCRLRSLAPSFAVWPPQPTSGPPALERRRCRLDNSGCGALLDLYDSGWRFRRKRIGVTCPSNQNSKPSSRDRL